MILKVHKLNIYHLACFRCLTQCLVLYMHNIFSSSPQRCSCSITKSCPTLQPHELQHIRLPCPLLSPWDCSDSCPLSKWCHPTILSSVTPPLVLNIFQNQGLSNESALYFRWPKYWSFSTSLSNEYAGLISFRIDWFDFFAVQGTLKSLLQHYISKALVLWRSAFCMVQLSHPYMTSGKIILTIQSFVSKVMSLLFKTLSRAVIAFFQRSKHLLIPWLQSLCTKYYYFPIFQMKKSQRGILSKIA